MNTSDRYAATIVDDLQRRNRDLESQLAQARSRIDTMIQIHDELEADLTGMRDERDRAQTALTEGATHYQGVVERAHRERDEANAARTRIESKLAQTEIQRATYFELQEAKREAEYQRSLSHDKLVAALLAGTRDLSGMIETVRDVIEYELAMHGGAWEDLSDRERRHIAGNVIQAIAGDLDKEQ